jgi:hypothetical protein
MSSVNHECLHNSAEWSHIKVEPGSQLDTMARLSPAARVRYVDALLKELDDAIASCTISHASTSADDAYEQIHALKNAVIPTGCQALLAACHQLQTSACETACRGDLEAGFIGIARNTRRLILAYRYI